MTDPASSRQAAILHGPADRPSTVNPQRWYLAHLRYNEEFGFAGDLLEMGLTYWFPTTLRRREVDGKWTRVESPLFRNYLAFLGDEENKYDATMTRRVVKIYPIICQSKFLEEMESVSECMKNNAEFGNPCKLGVGDRCRVISGPFRGQYGLVEFIDQKKCRLNLQIETMGRALPLENLDVEMVELV